MSTNEQQDLLIPCDKAITNDALITKDTLIIRVAVPTPLRKLFDYLPPKGDTLIEIIPGMRVEVPFGKQKLVAIVVATDNSSEFDKNALKHVSKVLDGEPALAPDILQLCQ